MCACASGKRRVWKLDVFFFYSVNNINWFLKHKIFITLCWCLWSSSRSKEVVPRSGFSLHKLCIIHAKVNRLPCSQVWIANSLFKQETEFKNLLVNSALNIYQSNSRHMLISATQPRDDQGFVRFFVWYQLLTCILSSYDGEGKLELWISWKKKHCL